MTRILHFIPSYSANEPPPHHSPHHGLRTRHRRRQIDEREILEIYPVRASLEELAGTLAAKNVADELGELEKAVKKMTAAFEDGDAREGSFWRVCGRSVVDG